MKKLIRTFTGCARSDALMAAIAAISIFMICPHANAQEIAFEGIPAERIPPGGWKPGIPGGIPAAYPLFCDPTVEIPGSTLLMVGDGVTDNTAALSAALSLCPNGQRIQLPAGDFRFNSEVLRAGRNNWDGKEYIFSFQLCGAGPDKTFLRGYGTSGSILRLASTGYAVYNVVNDYRIGDTILDLSAATQVKVGQWVSIFTNNTDAGISYLPVYMTDCMTQKARVVAKDENRITLDRPIRWKYANTKVKAETSEPYRCGIENLSIERMVSGGLHNIDISGGAECWLRNVRSRKPVKWNIRLIDCAGCEIRECDVGGFWNGGGDSSYGFGLFKTTGETLIENNIAQHCRHSYITEYGCQGNVFGYNYSRDPINENQLNTNYLMGDLSHHGGEPMYNLWEGNVAATIKWDNVLGGSKYNTAFRNQIQRKGLPVTIYATHGADIQSKNYYASLIGNYYETPPAGSSSDLYRFGFPATPVDALSESTAFRHGEVDEQNGSIYWNPAEPSRKLGPSLYLKVKPEWWDGGPWPAVGPDLVNKNGGNPAMRRANGEQIPMDAPPAPPEGLQLYR